jgi:hypothetical protein
MEGGKVCVLCGNYVLDPLVIVPTRDKRLPCRVLLKEPPKPPPGPRPATRLIKFIDKWYDKIEWMHEQGWCDNAVRMYLLKRDPDTPESKSIKKYFAIVSAQRVAA